MGRLFGQIQFWRLQIAISDITIYDGGLKWKVVNDWEYVAIMRPLPSGVEVIHFTSDNSVFPHTCVASRDDKKREFKRETGKSMEHL